MVAKDRQTMITGENINRGSFTVASDSQNIRDSTSSYINHDHGKLFGVSGVDLRITNEITSTSAVTNQSSRSRRLLTSSSSFAEAAARFGDPMYTQPTPIRLHRRASVLTDRTVFHDERFVRPLYRSRSAVVVHHVRKWASKHLFEKPRSQSSRCISISKHAGLRAKHGRGGVATFLQRMC